MGGRVPYSRPCKWKQPCTPALVLFCLSSVRSCRLLVGFHLEAADRMLESAMLAEDALSDLARTRTIQLVGEINDSSATAIVAQLLFLQVDSTAPARIEIDSPGGNVSAGHAILDTIQFSRMPVETCVTGRADALAAIIASTGRRGKRSAYPEARLSLLGPWSNNRRPDKDELTLHRDALIRVVAKHSGQSVAQVAKDFAVGRTFTAAEAVEYGLIDHVLQGPGARRCADGPMGVAG